MLARGKKTETAISVKLDEPMTTEGCLKLIVELMKYLLYNKQQIPFSYDSLALVQARAKPNDRNFMNIRNLFNSLCDVTNHLNTQFYTEGCNVREVVIIIGATIFSPKLCIRVELPEQILNSKMHTEYNHPSRKPLLNLMRSMIDSEEFQDAMNLPLGPTNTFVLVQKSDTNQLSEFFIPKPQYALPIQTPCFRIRLDPSEDIKKNCHCPSAVQVLHDSRSEYHIGNNNLNESNECKPSAPYQWYQSKEVIKGFKFLR